MAVLLTKEWQQIASHQIGSNEWGKWTAYLQAKYTSQDEDSATSVVNYRIQITVTGNGNYFTADDFETYINGVRNDMGKETFNKGTVTAQTVDATITQTDDGKFDSDGNFISSVTYRIYTTFGTSKATTTVEYALPYIETTNAYININGEIKKAQTYIGVNGVPIKCDVYVGVNGVPVKCRV